MNLQELQPGDGVLYHDGVKHPPAVRTGMVTRIGGDRIQVVDITVKLISPDQVACWDRPELTELRLKILSLVGGHHKTKGSLSGRLATALESICETIRGKVELR